LVNSHNYDGAFDAADSVLIFDKKNISALNIRGICFMHRKEYESALAVDYDRVTSLSPRYYPTILNKGLIRMYKKNLMIVNVIC
jgi:lipoprotein NlpI